MVSMIARKNLSFRGIKAGEKFEIKNPRSARLLFKLKKADYANADDAPAKPQVHIPDPNALPATDIFTQTDTAVIDDGFENGLDGNEQPNPYEGRQLGKVGQTDEQPNTATDEEAAKEELKAVREQYKQLFGKQPFMGWNIDELREKIAEKQAEA